MAEGVSIVCKKGALQWMITEKPYCLVNEAETMPLAWKNEVFIPLQPNVAYRMKVAFPYLGKKETMPAEFTATVKPGEISRFQYNTASTMFSKGKIKQL
jgi:hypothetical protein